MVRHTATHPKVPGDSETASPHQAGGDVADLPVRTARQGAITLAVVVALIALTPTVASLGLPNPAGATGDRIADHYNMLIGNDTSPLYAVGKVIVNTPLPYALSLNEVCIDDYLYIADALDDYGFSADFYQSVASSDFCNSSFAAGNAIYVRGSGSGGWKQQFTENGGSANRRGMVCLRRSYIYTVWTGCSAHMAVGPPPPSALNCPPAPVLYYQPAGLQLQEYRQKAQYFFGGTALWLMGDFNLKPRDASELCRDTYGSNFTEADSNNTFAKRGTKEHSPADIAIDYIFGFNAHLTRVPDASIFTDAPSDHHYYRGYYDFK